MTDREGRSLVQFNPVTSKRVQALTVGNGPGGVAVGPDAVWVANQIDGTLSRLDLNRGSVADAIPIGPAPADVAVGFSAVWVVLEETGAVVRYDPVTRSIAAAVNVGNGPIAVAVGADAVWVVNSRDGTVSRVDPATNSVSAVVRVGSDPSAVAVVDGSVWIAVSGSGWVSRIDPTTNLVTKTVRLGSRPVALVGVGRTTYVATGIPLSGHRGGILRVESDKSGCRCVDPTQSLGSQTDTYVAALLYDGLVAYRRAAGIAGSRLVPDLALRLPRPSADGRTYTFQLRPGLRYSDGSAVHASNFRSSIERALKVNPFSAFHGIAGAAACRPAAPCDLSKGIRVDDATRTITIHLVRSDPEFLYTLALQEASIIPASSPLHPPRTRPILGTGPYRLAAFDPDTEIRVVRNEHFRVWSADARPNGYADEIRIHPTPSTVTSERLLGKHALASVAAVEKGRADVLSLAFSGLAPAQLRGVFTRNAGTFHTDAEPETFWWFLNTRVAPFDDVRVRRALNFAVDRRAIVGRSGGVDAVTCQVLPPDLPGYHPYCPYTRNPNEAGTWSAPDLQRARALIAASGTAGMRVEVVAPDLPLPRGIGVYFVALLHRLGYTTSLRLLPVKNYNGYVADSRHHVQIGGSGWFADRLIPSNFLGPIMTCGAFVPRDPNNFNVFEYCNHSIDTRIRRAAALETVDRARADGLWARIDRTLVDEAVTVPTSTPGARVLLSKRVGNYQNHPLWGTLLDQLWVR